MGINCTNPESAVHALFDAIPDIVADEIYRAFSYLGEQCVRTVRDRPGPASWFDQTGNLRSSIGYAVYGKGRKVIESAFNTILNGTDGAACGRKMIDDLASKYAETYAFAVVAGMEYADFVEAMNGKDVLASTEIWARKHVDKYLSNALERAQSRIDKLQRQLGL